MLWHPTDVYFTIGETVGQRRSRSTDLGFNWDFIRLHGVALDGGHGAEDEA